MQLNSCAILRVSVCMVLYVVTECIINIRETYDFSQLLKCVEMPRRKNEYALHEITKRVMFRNCSSLFAFFLVFFYTHAISHMLFDLNFQHSHRAYQNNDAKCFCVGTGNRIYTRLWG